MLAAAGITFRSVDDTRMGSEDFVRIDKVQGVTFSRNLARKLANGFEILVSDENQNVALISPCAAARRMSVAPLSKGAKGISRVRGGLPVARQLIEWGWSTDARHSVQLTDQGQYLITRGG